MDKAIHLFTESGLSWEIKWYLYSQVDLLRKLFKEYLGSDVNRELDINTVDGFQGREKDVIIFSCVRSSPNVKGKQADSEAYRIGFLQDKRRMNVGLTRARASMLVVCNAQVLYILFRCVWRQHVTKLEHSECM